MVPPVSNAERVSLRKPRRNRTPKAPSPEMDSGSLRHSIRFNVLRANRLLSQNWTNSALDDSMRLLCYCTFALIGANPGVSLVELARYVVIDKSRASELVDAMEREHLISRRRQSKDHRKQGIYLTAAGIARLAIVSRQVALHEQPTQDLYSAEECQQLIGLLSRVRA